jgi:hypothetical protein
MSDAIAWSVEDEAGASPKAGARNTAMRIPMRNFAGMENHGTAALFLSLLRRLLLVLDPASNGEKLHDASATSRGYRKIAAYLITSFRCVVWVARAADNRHN